MDAKRLKKEEDDDEDRSRRPPSPPCPLAASAVAAWSKAEVAQFVAGIDRCEGYGEVG